MTKQAVYYLTEIRPEDFTGDGDGAAAPLSPHRFKVSSACAQNDARTAEVLTQIQSLGSKPDRHMALLGLVHLVKVAQSGPPFTKSFDKKALHETHSFHSAVSGQDEKIWRYRRGDIRILFYYADDKIVLLCGTLSKRKDQLSEAEKKAAEHAVDRYLSARRNGQVTWVAPPTEQ
jgi:mRNA-degrading endonuclease RelE of RelBE toxin-antitoxin system